MGSDTLRLVDVQFLSRIFCQAVSIQAGLVPLTLDRCYEWWCMTAYLISAIISHPGIACLSLLIASGESRGLPDNSRYLRLRNSERSFRLSSSRPELLMNNSLIFCRLFHDWNGRDPEKLEFETSKTDKFCIFPTHRWVASLKDCPLSHNFCNSFFNRILN